MHTHDVITIVAILVVGFFCHWISWRTKIPAILFLLLAGIGAGPVLGWLDSDALLGDLLVPVVSVGVAIILFEGSLTLKLPELRENGSVVRNLVSAGVLITWLIAGFAAYALLDWDLQLAALFGAIVTVSGPTVILPLLRAVRPAPAVARILRWEAILIDPLGAILALLTFDVIIATRLSQGAAAAALTGFATIVAAGTLIGAIGGYLFGLAIRRRLIPDHLREYAALAAVLAVYASAELVRGEAGLLAVTVMGIWLANMRNVEIDDVLSFKESLTLLLIAGLFILLAARINLDNVAAIGVGALSVIAVLQLVAGPLRSLVCTIGSDLNFRERIYLGWVFPRGIVAAAISALFALRLEEQGFAGADNLVPLVFSVILGTVIIQSLTAGPIAHWLKVAAPDPTGVLVIGSNTVARSFALGLKDAGHTVILADSRWAGIQEARRSGLQVFHGSAVSAYSSGHLDLTGIGVLLAASREPGLNELACVRYAEEFGRDNVYTLRQRKETGHEKHKISGESRGRVLFDGAHTIEQLLGELLDGKEVKATRLTDEYDFAAHQRQHPDSLLILAIDADQQVHFPVADDDFTPTEGWTIAELVPAGEESSAAVADRQIASTVP
jgi:CPA1 family monovalent cation:H+ antiporter